MKFASLHLSDMHLTGSSDSIFDKQKDITRAIKNKIRTLEKLFIIITGDVANKGLKTEYDSAKDLLNLIKKELIEYNPKLTIEFIIAPGNHDCDFSEDNAMRNLAVNHILSDKFTSKTIEPAYIDICTSVQKNFFNFRDSLHNKDAVIDDLNTDLFTRYEFQIEDSTIGFNVYNFAWMSKKHEQQADIFYPCFLIKDKLIKKSSSPKTINFSLYHHPLHWVNHKNLKNLKFLINSTSEIVFSGHEHTQNIHSELDVETDRTHYFDSAALQTGNINESHFKLITICIEDESEVIYDFAWDKSTSSYAESQNNNSLALEAKKNHYEFNDAYLTKINGTGVQITHPYKTEIYLDDIFIYQNLQVLTQDELKIKYNASRLKDFSEIKKTFIFGEETSGKSSLAYMLQMHLKSIGKIPIYITGKDIKRKDHTEDRVEKLIEKAFKRQYEAKYFSDFTQENISNIILLVDDFTHTELNNEYKGKLIDSLSSLYENIIIFSNTSLELEAFNNKNLAHPLNDYSLFKIQEFGHKLRDKLIKQWVVLGQEENIENDEVHRLVVEKAKSITSTLGLNIVPSYPIFLLTLLQAMEANSSTDLSDSSYGHYYSYLINESFVKNGISKSSWNLYHNYLSELAYDCFKSGNHNFTYSDLHEFHDKYKRKHKSDRSFESVLKVFEKTKILQDNGSNFKFTYDYLYYFYVSKNIAKKIHLPEIRKDVENLVHNSHKIEFGNILMFLVHHSNSEYIIEMLLVKTRMIFTEIEEFDFSDDQLKNINGTIGYKEKLIIEEKSVEEARETYLEHKEEEQSDSIMVKDNRRNEVIEEDVDLAKLDIFAKVNLAFKLTNILGEIAKSYCELDGDIKYKLVKEAYALNLRAVNVFIGNFEQNHELLTEVFQDVIEKKGYVTQDKIEIATQKIIFNTITRVTEGFISRLSKSLANRDLLPIFKELSEDNKDNKAIKMIYAAIELDFPKGLKPKVIKHHEELHGNYLAQAVLKRLVIDHMYMYHTEHNIKDSIMDKLEIEKASSTNMLLQKSQSNPKNFD